MDIKEIELESYGELFDGIYNASFLGELGLSINEKNDCILSAQLGVPILDGLLEYAPEFYNLSETEIGDRNDGIYIFCSDISFNQFLKDKIKDWYGSKNGGHESRLTRRETQFARILDSVNQSEARKAQTARMLPLLKEFTGHINDEGNFKGFIDSLDCSQMKDLINCIEGIVITKKQIIDEYKSRHCINKLVKIIKYDSEHKEFINHVRVNEIAANLGPLIFHTTVKITTKEQSILFMEYLHNGHTISDNSDGDTGLNIDFTPDLAVKFVKKLEILYENNFVHNDLHFDNIILIEDDVKFIDFGESIDLRNNNAQEKLVNILSDLCTIINRFSNLKRNTRDYDTDGIDSLLELLGGFKNRYWSELFKVLNYTPAG